MYYKNKNGIPRIYINSIKQIFRIKPFDILNCINIVRVSLGKEILEVTSRVYTTLINKWNYRC